MGVFPIARSLASAKIEGTAGRGYRVVISCYHVVDSL